MFVNNFVMVQFLAANSARVLYCEIAAQQCAASAFGAFAPPTACDSGPCGSVVRVLGCVGRDVDLGVGHRIRLE